MQETARSEEKGGKTGAGNKEHKFIGQKLGEDFAKFCGLLRIYELYL